MADFDNIKKNIRVNNMDDSERKQVFEKLVKSGGKVINDKPKTVIKSFDRDKQKQFVNRLNTHQEKIKSPEKKQAKTAAKANYKAYMKKSAVKGGGFKIFTKFFDRLIIKFRLFILGITDFNAYFFKNSFLETFNSEYKASIIEIQMLYMDIFKRNTSYAQAIINQLDKQRVLFFELIEFSADLYNRQTISSIIDQYIAYKEGSFKVGDYRNQFMELFRKLYILYSYQEMIYLSYEKAIITLQELEKGKASDYSSRKKKIKNNIYIIYEKLFPRLYWLFCYYYDQIIPLESISDIDEIFGITLENKPGNRTASSPAPSFLSPDLAIKTKDEIKKEQEEEKEKGLEELKKKSEKPLPDEIKRGLLLMNNVDLNPLAKKFIRDEILRRSYQYDNVLKAYLYFHDYDEQYSFLLNTNKIEYNIVFTEKGKVDYKQKFTDYFNQIRKCEDSFKEYFSSIELYDKMNSEKPLSANSEVMFKFSKRLSELEKDRSNKGKNARGVLRNLLINISENYQIIINDMNQQQKIVIKPQAVIEIDYAIEGNKILKGKKVYEAIGIANDFISAFVYRLSTAGDLGNDQAVEEAAVMDKNDKELDAIIDEKVSENEEPEKKSGGANIKPVKDDSSILSELDDLL